MSGTTIKARHEKHDASQVFLKCIIELMHDDKELHDATVRMLNAYTNLKEAQAERIKELTKKGDL